MTDPAGIDILCDPLPLAQALIRRPSVTPEDSGAIEVLANALASIGFHCIRLPFGDDADRPRIENLYARLGSGGRNVGFAGHTDVVPVGGGWTLDPFAADIVEGALYGRGAADMKAAIACFVAAVARWQAEGDIPGSVSLLITGDEEGRALDGTRRMLDWMEREGQRIDLCIVGEPTCARKLGDIIKIGRRGSLNGRLRVLGAQGHSAYPHLADNPIPRLVAMIGAITGEPLDRGSAHFQPSIVTPTTIDVGNPATNVIPAEARAGFNVRFNDLHTGRSVESWLRERFDRIGGAYELEIELSGESFLTPPGILSKALSDAVTAILGIVPELNTAGGTSDARFIKDHCPVAEFGLVGATMHKADERVALADLEALSRIYLTALRSLMSAA